jgi:lysozyme
MPVAPRPIPALAAQFLRKVEGCVLTPYQDDGGVWTCGYGHTGEGVIPGGPAVTEAQADNWLVDDLGEAGRRLASVCTPFGITFLNDPEYAALISFVFNLGVGDWAIFKDINNRNLGDVPAQMLRFDHGRVNGALVEIKGLKNRRLAEIALWNSGDVDVSAPVAGPQQSSGYVRAISTPPKLAAHPLALNSLVAKASAGVAAVGAGASQVQGIVAPHISEADIFKHAAVILTGVVIVCSAIGLFISNQQHKMASQ